MTQKSLSDSFIVRIYRVDTDHPCKITGLVEALDGTGTQEPFEGIDELADVLARWKRPNRRQNRRSPRQCLNQKVPED
jgi:hypothetical protein